MTREEASKILYHEWQVFLEKYVDYSGVSEAYKIAIKALEQEPKTEWIPVSERLPEKNGRYLVTRGLNAIGALWKRVYIVNFSDLMGIRSTKIFWIGNVGKSDFESLEDVIAWMPLPEPYQESEG